MGIAIVDPFAVLLIDERKVVARPLTLMIEWDVTAFHADRELSSVECIFEFLCAMKFRSCVGVVMRFNSVNQMATRARGPTSANMSKKPPARERLTRSS